MLFSVLEKKCKSYTVSFETVLIESKIKYACKYNVMYIFL